MFQNKLRTRVLVIVFRYLKNINVRFIFLLSHFLQKEGTKVQFPKLKIAFAKGRNETSNKHRYPKNTNGSSQTEELTPMLRCSGLPSSQNLSKIASVFRSLVRRNFNLERMQI